MATVAEWVEGARPRTLPTAISPVVVGTGAALGAGALAPGAALLALLVAVALVIGVNFANDYSDGVRGTDDDRVGPQRLVGSRAASPAAVRTAAFACFGVAALAGLALVAVSGQWWMIAVGAVCIVAAWFYTGGKRPYGYAGLGEVAVFVFFGPVAVLGTALTQVRTDTGGSGAVGSGAVLGAIGGGGLGRRRLGSDNPRGTPRGPGGGERALGAIGAGVLACAVLVANNLRDIPGDRVVGKRTLAVMLGDRATRLLWTGLAVLPFVLSLAASIANPALLVTVLALPLLVRPLRRVLGGAQGMELIPVLRDTGLLLLAWSVAAGVGLALGGSLGL